MYRTRHGVGAAVDDLGHAAVVGPRERDDPPTASRGPGHPQREQGRFGARVGEPYPLHGRIAVTEHPGQPELGRVRGGKHRAGRERGRHRLDDRPERVPVDQRGVVVENVDVLVAVEVTDQRTVALGQHDRVRLVERDRTGSRRRAGDRQACR